MKKLIKLLLIIILLVILGYLGSLLLNYLRTPTEGTKVDITDQHLINQGKYIAQTADCIACHTAPGGKSFAGGLAMQTPMGAIYSTNITPDKETGIGKYSFAQFDAAVRHGLRQDGSPLYPAMPYTSYVIMPDEDVKALYAYFMSLPAIKQENIASTIPPVLNWRWPLAYWQMLFAPKREFIAPQGASNEIVRGAYLVEGPGHCGACHTPRGIAYQEKAMSLADGDAFLTGALIDGWRAKSLRGEQHGLGLWSAKELATFLKTGRNEKTAAFGAMSDVVEHSTQHWTDGDIKAMVAYLKSLPPSKVVGGEVNTKLDETTQALLDGKYSSRGAVLYAEYCMICHRIDGKGVANIFPALDGNTAVIARHPQSAIQVTLEGAQMAKTPDHRMAFVMPRFNFLDDKEIADLLTFVRTAWTNTMAEPVSENEVAKIREFLSSKAPNAGERDSNKKLEYMSRTYNIVDNKTGKVMGKYTIPDDTAIAKESNADQIRYGLRLLNETRRLLPNNVGDYVNCNSCHIAEGKVPGVAPYINTWVSYPRFNPRAGRVLDLVERINGCFTRSMNGKMIDPNGPEMKAMVAYIKWLGQGVPRGQHVDIKNAGPVNTKLVPNPEHGKVLYEANCASCHGEEGNGLKDARGHIIFPPVWGDESFNIGAGMARTYKAASFVKYGMPMAVNRHGVWGQGDHFSDQDAVDIAEYFTHMPRPMTDVIKHDWPQGKRPKDARY